MKMAILGCAIVCAIVFPMCGALAADDSSDTSTREILALERKVMDGWRAGNPDPFLAIADPEITYFHAVTEKRIDGRTAVAALVEGYRGMPLFDSFEMAEPKVQVSGDTAVLTYILVRHVGAATTRWNSTVVYQRKTAGWRIIHAHWSETKAAGR
jgi:ketosteroid isomerase-like protein